MKALLILVILCGLIVCGVKCRHTLQNDSDIPMITDTHQHDNVISELTEFLTSKRSIYSYLYPEGLTLAEKLQLEETEWHWYPWKRIPITYNVDGEPIQICDNRHSIYDFPDDLFTQEQRLQGAIILHFLGAIYFFTVTAMIVNDYFIPSVQCICDDLGLSADVAAGTFMATATTMPEFFSNLISTFIAKSDMGVGNILGSLMFNTLIIAAAIGFFDTGNGQMNWWQLTRDCFLFGINATLLTIFGWDGQIIWWEAMILLIFVIIYYGTMFQNERIKRVVTHFVDTKWNWCFRYNSEINKMANKSKINSTDKKIETISTNVAVKDLTDVKATKNVDENTVVAEETPVKKERKSLWKIPQTSNFMKFYWFYSWPIKFALTCLIPSPKTYRMLYPVSFIMSIVVIGLNSYMTVWMLTTIGYTFRIPESVMGLTILAYGGCLPELFTALISSRNGQGPSNYSNALGTNSLSILFSLGLPWFLRGVIDKRQDLPPLVNIGSYGIEYIILSLTIMITLLYAAFYLSNFRFQPKISIFVIFIYLLFMTLAILIELDIIMPDSLC